ncbi:hypothetical protein J3492_00275 [Psychrobacter sp. F1192]|uniref:Uncharacterized protein n=1 Tax=Psychrobacter coccoides TaxID=2818440 RepID=A0ABS3NKV0_9GAMM|nr:hypothetical protein [Psychrobacter coccoides]MBO1529649.1 hypothetical protein [Psychrobacter coccoides]
MYIFISYQVLFFIAFLLGLATSILFRFVFNKSKSAISISDKYDGTNGYGYQPRPTPPQAEGALKKPPKPSYNPHK